MGHLMSLYQDNNTHSLYESLGPRIPKRLPTVSTKIRKNYTVYPRFNRFKSSNVRKRRLRLRRRYSLRGPRRYRRRY